MPSSFANAGADGSHDPEASDADARRYALPLLTRWAVAARSRARSTCRQLNPGSRGCIRARTTHDPRTHYKEKRDDANRRSSCNCRSQVLRVHEKAPVHGKLLSAISDIQCSDHSAPCLLRCPTASLSRDSVVVHSTHARVLLMWRALRTPDCSGPLLQRHCVDAYNRDHRYCPSRNAPSHNNMVTTIRSPLKLVIMIRGGQKSSGATRKEFPSETGTRAISILGSYSIQQFGRMTPSVADCAPCVGDLIRIRGGCKERAR